MTNLENQIKNNTAKYLGTSKIKVNVIPEVLIEFVLTSKKHVSKVAKVWSKVKGITETNGLTVTHYIGY